MPSEPPPFPGMPRWVKVFGLLALGGLLTLKAVTHLAGGGHGHGAGHDRGAAVPGEGRSP